MGGLLRRASFLKNLSGKDSLLNFDLGNNFPITALSKEIIVHAAANKA